ncbi:Porin MspC precursor [Nocardia otitidiscaviarum]|uniref:Porin n=1 Tax=Nocardia otitidiscaviarum TaxID=1823 RepID=A0A379JMB2_9NOCA|nr:MspA family porin [Nocardia otitidiscaviarum]MBF6180287.1 MspA family porin [Nocardia otitidiscaviarum]MCP9619425.1 MspA family porin [Nocardia otitidiscaviarum]QDP79245.1 porin [Nocardia otitidiscaviarum]SUD49143.1 Porin MspC precursor [Nocardia otitidiscaviarum]
MKVKHRATVRTMAVAAAVTIGLALGSGTGLAGIDSSSSILDRQDRTVEAIQSDTRIDFVPPLDGNPLTREWFHHGTASYRISGPHAEDWEGHITIGYQVGYPATLDGKIRFQWWTPSLGVELDDSPGVNLGGLIPQAGIELAVGFGPGIQTVEAAGGDVFGSEGFIRMSGMHATVSGVIGQVTIRPWVRVVSAGGDAVITYGPLWTI